MTETGSSTAKAGKESLFPFVEPVEALRMIAASLCTPNMSGNCVGATREHRIRGTGPHTDTPREYRTVVNCPKHFAQAVLDALGTGE